MPGSFTSDEMEMTMDTSSEEVADAPAGVVTDVLPVAAEDAPSPQTPEELVTEHHAKIALEALVGDVSEMKNFEVENFTSTGDNFMGEVKLVSFEYVDMAQKTRQTTAVVKLNPLRFQPCTSVVFMKEDGFFEKMLPLLNTELKRMNERPLRVPRFLHSVKKEGREVIYLENLKAQGYVMVDKKKGMDREHSVLVVKELARLHAASVLLMSKPVYFRTDMVAKFPVLQEVAEIVGMRGYVADTIKTGVKIAKMLGNEDLLKYLQGSVDDGVQIFMDQLQMMEPFKVICHGDCWNNNFLFRYADDGHVEECRLLDLQGIRVGSPALDLNYFFFTSLPGETRRKEMDNLLSTYYATFSSVLAGGGVSMKFTLPQLKEEFMEKNQYGLVMGLMLIPLVMAKPEQAPDMSVAAEEASAKYQDELMIRLENDEALKMRLKALFDDMLLSGFLKETVPVTSAPRRE